MVEKEKKWTEEEYQKWLSYDKTMTINEETKWTERDKHDFVNFCWYNRRLRKVRPGSTKINEDKNGEKYASIEVKRGDCPEFIDDSKKAETKDWIENNIQTERNELRLDKENDFKFNEDFKYKFSFKIPENFPLSPTRLVIWQWKYNKIEGSSEKWDPSPMLAQRIQKIEWKYYFTITDWVKKKNILRKIPFNDIKGKWINMDYELRFSDKKDENGNPIPCTVKLKADIEWERKIDEKKEFYLAEENNLQFNSKESHSGYFKFWLYRDNYDYAKTKIKDKEGLNEIKQAQKTEEQNPMEIHFKNFSMEKLNTNTENIEQSRVEQKNEAKKLTQEYLNWDTDDAKHLTRLLKQGDTMKIYSEFFKINEKFKLAIENLQEPQTQKLYTSLQFLMPGHRDYINETQKKYQDLFNKVKKFNQDNLLRIIEENDTDKIIDLKNQSKKLKSWLKKLKKYEKWEFINLPNWLSYEFCKKDEEDSIPNWINLWENDYFIKPHVSENYDLFIGSLLEIKQLLKKNKWINIKYCKAMSWLMNIEFLRWYFWDQKPNIIRIFEQMEPACVSFKIDENNNAATQKNPHKNPIRFIKEDSKLYNYITNGHKEQFCEAEMWLDLDRLEIVNWLKEKNDYIIESYSIKDIINDGRIQPKDKIHTIINIIHNDIKNWDDHRKVTIDWKVLPFSCWNKALLLNQIFKEYWNELWITESYVAQPNWHAMNIIKFNWDFCIADSSDGTIFANIEQNYKIRHIGNIDVFELKKPLKNNQWEYNYTIFPIINLWSKTELYISAALEEYDLSVKEKMYQKTSTNDYKKLKAYVETLINSNELNPLNYFTWEEYLWIAKNKEDIKYKKQIKELEYLMQDTKSLNEIQERRKILQTIKQELDIDENLINKINNKQKFFNKISKSIAKIFK